MWDEYKVVPETGPEWTILGGSPIVVITIYNIKGFPQSLLTSILHIPSALPVGLRGAIAYALALNLADQGEAFGSAKVISVLDTTTLLIVLFTIIVCGGSTLPILKVGVN